MASHLQAAVTVLALLTIISIAIASVAPFDPTSADSLLKTSSTRPNNLGARDEANVEAFEDNGGYVKYDGFGANDRVLGAEAMLNADTYTNVQGSFPLQSIRPAGFESIGVTGGSRHRCHLIANQLGGSGRDARNLFTCFAHMNTPEMLFYENKVATKLAEFANELPPSDEWRRDKGVKHNVTLLYDFPHQHHPSRVRIRSEFFEHDVFQHVLQDLIIYNIDYPNREIRFQCDGEWDQTFPPSMAGHVSTSTTPCTAAPLPPVR